MRKESILGLASAAVALPAIFSGCRGQETSRSEQDYSKYIPLVVSVDPALDACVNDTDVFTYRAGDHLKLLALSTSEIFDFQVTIDGDTAQFASDLTPYIGTVKEGNLFGVLNDPEGKGASPVAKLLEVNSDSIKIALVDRCDNPQV